MRARRDERGRTLLVFESYRQGLVEELRGADAYDEVDGGLVVVVERNDVQGAVSRLSGLCGADGFTMAHYPEDGVTLEALLGHARGVRSEESAQ